MKNRAIALDEATAAWARLAAAQRAMSVSRFVGEVLRERIGEARLRGGDEPLPRPDALQAARCGRALPAARRTARPRRVRVARCRRRSSSKTTCSCTRADGRAASVDGGAQE
jgi:hypothetical protein